MYDRLNQRADVNWLAGPPARTREAVTFHTGTRHDFARRRELAVTEAAQRGEQGLTEIGPQLLHLAADTRSLRNAWDDLRHLGGQAPGPNGLSYSDLSQTEVWPLLRTLNSAIHGDSYRHGPDRKVRHPKSSGTGTRTLRLSNIEDRVVAKAILQTIQPALDLTFDDRSHGYRPGRGREHALHEATQLTAHGLQVWVVEDIRDAFDHVPQQRLLQILQKRLPNAADLLQLIERVLENGTKRGLRQGCPLSPLLLNVYLDHVLDRVWRQKFPDIPLLRTADDLLILCHSVEEAQQAYAALRQILLPTGMCLKGNTDTNIRDPRKGDDADWLGYRIKAGAGDLEVRIGEKAWKGLEQGLELAHEHEAAPLLAPQILLGWLGQQGPCLSLEDQDQVIARVRETALALAFEELPEPEELRERWYTAHQSWQHLQTCLPLQEVDGSACQTPAAPLLRCGDGASPLDAPSPFSFIPPGSSVTVYTDGSCGRWCRIGGWGAVIEYGPGPEYRQGSGSIPRTTNNRAELIAVIEALKVLPTGLQLRIVSDSRYVVDGITRGLAYWKSHGWRTSSRRHKRAVQNQDLWQQVDGLLRQHANVQCGHVKGHAGHPQNERCHALAEAARCSVSRPDLSEYLLES